jgi:charged multivesicular body protein 1
VQLVVEPCTSLTVDDHQNANPPIRQSPQRSRSSESKSQKGTLLFILTKAIQQGTPDIARIHAGNAIRKEQERLNLLRLASRIEAVASRVRTAVTMKNVCPVLLLTQVTGNMAQVVRGMDRAMESMNPERVCPLTLVT